jgi:hypothetical protein
LVASILGSAKTSTNSVAASQRLRTNTKENQNKKEAQHA